LGALFAIASLITPLLLGTLVERSRLPASATWRSNRTAVRRCVCLAVLSKFTLAVGVFALTTFAFLAAVYLTLETGDRALQEDFRWRALGAGVALAGAAALVLVLSGRRAPLVREGLIFAPWAVPLHLATAATAATALAALWRRSYRVARIAAVGQVSFILWGWR